MFHQRPDVRALCSIAGLSVLAACSGGSPSPVAQLPVGAGPMQQSATSRVPVSPDTCQTTGIVQVIPCHITFTNSQAKQVTVSSTNPSQPLVNSTEKDNCSGIATFQFTFPDYGIWTVTPGSTTGKCKATFTGYNSKGKAVGTAVLKITNKG